MFEVGEKVTDRLRNDLRKTDNNDILGKQLGHLYMRSNAKSTQGQPYLYASCKGCAGACIWAVLDLSKGPAFGQDLSPSAFLLYRSAFYS